VNCLVSVMNAFGSATIRPLMLRCLSGFPLLAMVCAGARIRCRNGDLGGVGLFPPPTPSRAC